MKAKRIQPADSGPASRHVYDGEARWIQILRRAGISSEMERELTSRAERHGTSLHAEVLACGGIDHKLYFRCIAEELGLAFCEELDSARLVMRSRDVLAALAAPGGPRIVHYAGTDARMSVLVSPARLDLEGLAGYLQRYPDIASRMMVVEPGMLRRALLERARPLLTARARRELALRYPGFSASTVADARQGFALGAGLTCLIVLILAAPAVTLLALHGIAILFFLACGLLRLAAACRPVTRERLPPAPQDLRCLPTYSVLVALYREREVVEQLVGALARLQWPRSKLEVKLVCEEDDVETQAALRHAGLPRNFEILLAPPAGPRTKPKALAFALPVISGQFVVVYDAEDIPHPAQLREAWQAFEQGGADLACVQAPLAIANGDANWLTRMFAFEYAALFRGLLPALAAWNAYLPLGGTSNHFRTGILRQVGGWDPYNVTEDADLALRLCRHGYRIGTLTLPTQEDAPDRLKPWFHQRSRWYKGWLQTLLVHWRTPVLLCLNLSPVSLVTAHILLFGICLSSLAHLFLPVFIGIMASKALGNEESLVGWIVLAMDAIGLGLAYLGFLLLGWRSGNRRRAGFAIVAASLPIYWMLLSAAAWHALYKVVTDPFHWAKTPHRRSVLHATETNVGGGQDMHQGFQPGREAACRNQLASNSSSSRSVS